MSHNDLYSLPAAEKLHIIETLWDKLNDEDIESPQWHQDVLMERKTLYDQGKLKLISLDDLKKTSDDTIRALCNAIGQK